jgi:hypothetical protein
MPRVGRAEGVLARARTNGSLRPAATPEGSAADRVLAALAGSTEFVHPVKNLTVRRFQPADPSAFLSFELRMLVEPGIKLWL